MKKTTQTSGHFKLPLSIAAFGLMVAVVVLPTRFQTAASGGANGGTNQTGDARLKRDAANRLSNYDIRTDKAAAQIVAGFRKRAGKTVSALAERRDEAIAAERKLRERVPTLKIEYSRDLNAPEVIAPDAAQGRGALTGATTAKRSVVARQFVAENKELFGLDDRQTQELRVAADYSNPNGNLSFVSLEQFISDIPVFRGELKAGFTRSGEMFRVVNNLAPDLDYARLPTAAGSAEAGVAAALKYLERETEAISNRNAAESTELRVVFGAGDEATIAEKMYFPIESGSARLAWRVLVWEREAAAYYVIVDAETNDLLWRKNITADQTQTATYNVYATANNMLQTLHSPAPFIGGLPNTPAGGQQAASLPRTNVTLVGNEAPNTFNNLGWITDNLNTTEGNNVEAGVDRESPNGIDPNGKPVGNNRVFNFNYNPGGAAGAGEQPTPSAAAPCSTAGNSPVLTEFQKGVVTQLFYLTNRYHDEMYKLGFTEAAGNFQNDNFGRGGNGNDRVSAEAQDCGGTNNANFTAPADGSRGRMQMYIFNRPTPGRDGSLDSDIVVHELTHGLSFRLVGNSSGLNTLMAGGMGEGWSDFYGLALLSDPSDPVNGVYPTGGYSTYLLGSGFTSNYYYGIRRFPYALIGSTGGANNRPHNPLTFADIDGSQFNVSDGAFTPAFGTSYASVDGVHNVGEIWAAMLWEVRGKLVQRLGGAEGNRRALQVVTDGMKLTPLNPTLVQARDAIVSAAYASGATGTQDAADVWAGFALRGLGVNAEVVSQGSSGNNRVVESFTGLNVSQLPTFTFSDAANGNNNNLPEPSETLTLTIPLANKSGVDATGVSLQVVGGGSASYGDLANGASATRTVAYTVPANSQCGATQTVTFNITSSLGSYSLTRTLRLGKFNAAATENFDSVAAPALPSGWTTSLPTITGTNGGQLWRTVSSSSTSAPNSAFAPEPTVPSVSDLESPTFNITSATQQLAFDLKYNTEDEYDGAVLDISINGAAYQDILTAGGSFAGNGYNLRLRTTDPTGSATDNPIRGRQAWSGISNVFMQTVVNLPASAVGQPVKFRWRSATDTGSTVQGVFIDNVQIVNGFSCAAVTGGTNASNPARADFDGDGKTDRAVFRSGTWYVLRSATGFIGQAWGAASDQTVTGDFDADGRDDFAVYRPGAVSYWYIINSGTGAVSSIPFGTTGDVPVTGDFNGDFKDDIGVFRNGAWYIAPSGGGALITAAFGQAGDKPVVADYDGDNKADIAVTRGGTWFILGSTAGYRAVQFGQTGDTAVPADYDGDNKDDIAVFRGGNWYIVRSSDGQFQATAFGQTGDIPVPGDYDGDRKEDLAVYRSGNWYVINSSSGFNAVLFGLQGDAAVPALYTRTM